jgi:hypothetical protein
LPTQDFLTEERVEKQKSELPTQDFLKEERVEKQKSELPTQDFLIEERVEEQKSEFEPSTQGSRQEESAEDKFLTQGEILSHPENSVLQTIVLRYLEIGGILCTKQRSDGIVSI